MIVTNGDRWEMYEVFRPARLEDRKLVSITIQDEPAHESALKTLHIWQPNLGSGSSVISPPAPVIGIKDGENGNGDPPGPTPPEPAGGWIPITDAHPVGGAKAPSAVRFPGGGEKPIQYWKHVLVEVAEWLIRNSALNAGKCPIGRGRSRYIIHSQPKHPNGKDFFEPRSLPAGLFVETNISASKAVSDCTFLIQHVGQSNVGVEVLLS